MAPRDITNCVRQPAPTKQITPTAPRRAVQKAPADDCAVVTPDGNTYDAWRGDPATHLPEEVFHLVLALAGGRACVGAASVRRAWRLATATTLDTLPPFASSTNSSLRLTWAGHRRHRHLVEARDGAHGTYAAAPATRKRRDVDLSKELRRTGSGWGCLGASFGGARALDDCIIVMDLAGREFEKRKAWHARDLPSLSKQGAGFLEFDCGWSLRDDFDEEARARCRDLSARGDDATARVVFFESVENLSIDLVAYSLSEDVVIDLCHWNPDSRVDEIHTIGKSLVIVAESDGLSRDPVNALGSHVLVPASLWVIFCRVDGVVRSPINTRRYTWAPRYKLPCVREKASCRSRSTSAIARAWNLEGCTKSTGP